MSWIIVRCCNCQEYHPFMEEPNHGYCYKHQCQMRYDDWCSRGIQSEETPDDQLFLGDMRSNFDLIEFLEDNLYYEEC